jgi:hypothetical protein
MKKEKNGKIIYFETPTNTPYANVCEEFKLSCLVTTSNLSLNN